MVFYYLLFYLFKNNYLFHKEQLKSLWPLVCISSLAVVCGLSIWQHICYLVQVLCSVKYYSRQKSLCMFFISRNICLAYMAGKPTEESTLTPFFPSALSPHFQLLWTWITDTINSRRGQWNYFTTLEIFLEKNRTVLKDQKCSHFFSHGDWQKLLMTTAEWSWVGPDDTLPTEQLNKN